ncbi:PTS glucitol/sorbitol transporter subunit IIA [Lacticaseibacillus yichunensis]|uniref:PTS glucitol/sorbitol transporter subunit IIA n=1 Tax=Lacticaseibacillus yichunensis TaxID=2486015 RepID=A0ABW4CNP6_9LACO|nr:PTS glucitol/sorbitol transporter subunit IIA [Lacticaseibacillus yichunensis]
METTSVITAIGPDALGSDAALVILFGETATVPLQDVSVIQRFTDRARQQALTLAEGDTLQVGSQGYTITHVGALANENLQAIGHVALVFGPVPAESPLANALYLTPAQVTTFAVGETLTYRTAE